MGKEESTEKNIAEEQNETAEETAKQEGNNSDAQDDKSKVSEEEKTTETQEEELSPTEKADIEIKEAKDKYLRLYSEFENYRRRTSKERVEFTKTATEKLITELLPILDDFERAQKTFPEENEGEEKNPVREGFEIIYNKFKKTLEKQGVKEIENPTGKELDTNFHEAITQFPAPKEELKGKIVDQVEKGYLLGEKVVRFSKVVVGI